MMEDPTGVWRDDEHPRERPTVNSVSIHATDEICTEDIFTLLIRHVRKFPGGKGFMPSVHYAGHLQTNGNVHLGTGGDAYAGAVREGRECLKRCIEHLEGEMAKYGQARA